MKTKESFVIQGLAGKKKLRGSVVVRGAKNAALKAMAAAVLFDGPVILQNVPNTDDIHTLAEVMRKLGAEVSWIKKAGAREHVLEIDPTGIVSTDIDPTLAGSMRASVVLTGPLLARFGKVSFPAPGGCVIGARPIDLFIEGYRRMGAHIELDERACLYRISAPKGLSGMEMFFDKVSVGGTETLMMAAALATGTTVLKNCAMEPEIVNVAEWLMACGAKISGVGSPIMEIEGVPGRLLSAAAAEKDPYVTIPDRIETGSFLLLGALCAEELEIRDCRPDHLESLVAFLKSSGLAVETTADTMRISHNTKPASSFTAIADLRTHEYPGFPTDLQAPMVAYLACANGESRIFETIYEGRFKYVEDLSEMGASITVMNPREILVKGPASLHELPPGEELTAHDIRAGFAVVMAALAAKGKFTVNNVHLIDRGYEDLEVRLKALGADIQRKTGE